MKASVSLPGDRTQARREEHRKALRLTRVIEAMTATVLQHLAERGHPTGRFFWDGLTGEFCTSRLVSPLSLRSGDGSITAEELVVESTARITGDVRYERITIAPGSRIEGHFTHKGSVPVAELKLIASESA